MKTIITILSMVIVFAIDKNSTAQEEHPKNRDYSKVDAYIYSLQGEDIAGMGALADSISKNFTDEADKTRAVFIWITDNIAYDCEQYHSKKTAKFTQRKKENRGDAMDRWHNKMIKISFKRKKGVCYDYALLFRHLCRLVSVECELVEGGARYPDDLPDRRRAHAWNKVKISGEWYTVDATWASGYADKKVLTFTKKLDERYWLACPEDIAESHFEKRISKY